jgi:uncharacterized protein
MRIVFVLSLLLPVVASHPAAAQSFDCASARNEDEETICSIRDLGDLDSEMAGLYRDLEGRLPVSLQRMLLAMQRGWLQSRRACGADDQCLSEHYLARIAELRALADTDFGVADSARGNLRGYDDGRRGGGYRSDGDRGSNRAPDPYARPDGYRPR